jgi:tetratricopeptide (TPR) repeat protein
MRDLIMRKLLLTLGLLLVALPALQAQAPATDGEATARREEGLALLRQGNFQGAMTACAQAYRLDPDNPTSLKLLMAVRSMVMTREALASVEEPARWERYARTLRTLYVTYRVHGELLPLDTQLHTRLGTAETAVLLAGTQLQQGLDREAAELLSGLEEPQRSLHARILEGIARARLGEQEQASALLAQSSLPESPGPGVLFDMARLTSLLGQPEQALGHLRGALAGTPPSDLEELRRQAKQSGDLAAARDHDGFADALATASKVAQSSCSGGSGCGSCSMRDSCPSAQKHHAGEGEEKESP